MSTRLDTFLVAAALVSVGVAGGCVLTTVVGPEPEVIVRTHVTTMPAPPPRTLPPRTIEVTRTVERASRSSVRETPHLRTQRSTPITGVMQAYASARVPAAQWPCLRQLWQRESGWNPRSVGALVDGVHVVGIPQLRGLKVTDGWRYQIVRGLTYIEHRHGTPCAAWAHFGRKGWY